MELTREEGRVLGCLVEKQLTTPQAYPLTENSLIAACNQTTSRDPVVAYDITTVRITVRGLREKGLLRMVHRNGERSEKHQHLLDSSLALSAGPLTLLAVLLLRGPQTPAELRVRSERMYPFDTLAQVQEALDVLAEREDPLAVRLDRQPGRKEARYGQLLVDAGQAPAGQAPAGWVPAGRAPGGRAPADPPADPVPADPDSVQAAESDGLTLVDLAREVGLLRDEVAELRAQVDGRAEDIEKG